MLYNNSTELRLAADIIDLIQARNLEINDVQFNDLVHSILTIVKDYNLDISNRNVIDYIIDTELNKNLSLHFTAISTESGDIKYDGVFTFTADRLHNLFNMKRIQYVMDGIKSCKFDITIV